MSAARILGGLSLLAALSTTAQAQAPSVSLAARGGGFNGLTSVDPAGGSDFKKVGFDVGGGVRVNLHRYVALRGDFTFARNELRTNSTATGFQLDRFSYDGAVQLQAPVGAVTPYLFAGGGAITLDPRQSGVESVTRGAATFGLGVEYAIPGSPFSVFVEGKSWLYRLEDLGGPLAGTSKTQYDVAWNGGFSYRLPL